MKRERLEDLGRVHERLKDLINDDFWQQFESKHSLETFSEYEKENADVTFANLRHIKWKLDEIYSIVLGDEIP